MRLSQADDEGCPASVEVRCAPNLRKQGEQRAAEYRHDGSDQRPLSRSAFSLCEDLIGRLSDGGSGDTEGKSHRRGAIGRQHAWHLMQDPAVKAMLKHHSMWIMTLRSVTRELTATEMHRLRKRVLHCCA